MLLPDRVIPPALAAFRANAPFRTAAGANKLLHERTVRPGTYGPPRWLRKDVSVSVSRTESGWPLYSVTPNNTAPRGTVVYLHGGGWVNEISVAHWMLIAEMAAEAGTTVQVLIYPLVPFGTARQVIDGVTAEVLRCTRIQGPTLLAGDSAGGQIVLSSILQLRDQHGVTLPRTIAISPAVDLSMKNPEIARVQPEDPWLGTRGTLVFIELWRGALCVDDPTVSPINGPLEGLGPITLFSGTRDILNPDGRLFAKKAAEAGVDVDYLEEAGQLHVYPLLPTAIGRAARQHIVQRVVEAIRA